MHLVDWVVVVAYFAWIVSTACKRSHRTNEVEGYFLANRSLPWWAVGLSVMATQLRAITLVGTTGRGYGDGMRVLQFYFGLPLAMIILSVTVVPFFYRAGVYTAYEYLERRFDVKTRDADQLAVPAVARPVVRRGAVGAGGRPVGDLRLEPAADGAGDRRAGGRLHDGRRRAGRDLDRREADGGDRRRRGGRASSC